MTTLRITKQKVSILAVTAITALVVVSSVFASAVPAQQAQAVNFGNVVDLSKGSEGIFYYDAIASGSNVYVARSYSVGGKLDIFFARSANNGATFSAPINISNNSGDSNYQRIAVSNNNVYLVWQDDSTGNKEIFFARSANNGATFSAPINISNNGGDSESPIIAASGNNVYAVWRDTTPGNYDIFLRASTNNGASFGDAINLSKNNGDSLLNGQLAPIVVSGNNVYIAWQDHTTGNWDILFTKSTDSGATFSTINISNNSGTSVHPEIAIIGNNVYAVWLDDTFGGTEETDNLFFARSTDDGATFSKPVNISKNKAVGIAPKLAVSGDNVYVVWFEGAIGYRTADFDVFFARSTDRGVTFSNPVNLSNNVASSANPRIAASGNDVYVLWQDNALGNHEILLRTSTDNGANFSAVINLSNNGGQSAAPRITVSDDNIYTIWMDNTLGKADLFFRAGTKVSN